MDKKKKRKLHKFAIGWLVIGVGQEETRYNLNNGKVLNSMERGQEVAWVQFLSIGQPWFLFLAHSTKDSCG